MDKFRGYETSGKPLESTRVYLDLPFLFPDCDDIGYYCDNIKLESSIVYLDLPFFFPDCDDVVYYGDNTQLSPEGEANSIQLSPKWEVNSGDIDRDAKRRGIYLAL